MHLLSAQCMCIHTSVYNQTVRIGFTPIHYPSKRTQQTKMILGWMDGLPHETQIDRAATLGTLRTSCRDAPGLSPSTSYGVGYRFIICYILCNMEQRPQILLLWWASAFRCSGLGRSVFVGLQFLQSPSSEYLVLLLLLLLGKEILKPTRNKTDGMPCACLRVWYLSKLQTREYCRSQTGTFPCSAIIFTRQLSHVSAFFYNEKIMKCWNISNTGKENDGEWRNDKGACRNTTGQRDDIKYLLTPNTDGCST